MIDESLFLSDAEFDALDPEDQDRYLDLLGKEGEEWKLNPRQQEAEDMSAETDEFLYGGAAGGGKSLWLLWHADKLSRKVPGHVSLMLRTSFPELRRTLIRDSLHLFATTRRSAAGRPGGPPTKSGISPTGPSSRWATAPVPPMSCSTSVAHTT
jgi:hypothetical protein